MKDTILIVDDDNALLKMLSQYFTLKGYQIITANNGIRAIEQISQKPDLILLDVNMPCMDGIEVCKKIRDTIQCPILFLTARVEESDRIQGLMAGGDDYILKPFSLKELEARIYAHIKREERHKAPSNCRRFGALVINDTEKRITYEQKELDFTKTEFEIVSFLSLNAGQVFDKERIYERVCGYDAEGDSRGITELIRRIRKKLSNYSSEDYIETVWGIGYRWRK